MSTTVLEPITCIDISVLQAQAVKPVELYGGFTQAEIERQCRLKNESKDEYRNFLFLQNPDGSMSDICVKSYYGPLADEYEWLKRIRNVIAPEQSRLLRVAEPIALLKRNHLVMRSDHTVPSLRQIMHQSPGQPLDAAIADRVAEALALLRKAMGPVDLRTNCTPRSLDYEEGWYCRGPCFDWDQDGMQPVRRVKDLLDYISMLSEKLDRPVVPFEPLSWNHGDPHNSNFGYKDGVVWIWDFADSCYGPAWFDTHSMYLYGEEAYTGPMLKAMAKHGLTLTDEELRILENFRLKYSRTRFRSQTRQQWVFNKRD